mmetsp:Transcript_5919/g.23316  ORF Transcript_5919/g.23316 Transcript_5919/m.23316 type:complete len:166 (-) Transcript_5919:449-946(-)
MLIEPDHLNDEELHYFYWFRTLESLNEFILSVPDKVNGRKHDHRARVLMTLLYLRRGYGMRAVGFFFGISRHTVSRVLEAMLPSLAVAAQGAATPRLLTEQDAELHVPQGHRFIKFKCKIVTDGTYFFFVQPEHGKLQRSLFTKNKARHCHKFLVMCHSDVLSSM